MREVSGAFSVLFGLWLLLLHPPSFCVSAKPFVTAIKGPSRERQSPPEHGLHVLGSDRLCHGYPQQTGTARHPAPSLPWSRGKTPLCSLLFHPVQLHAVQRVVVAVECEGGGKPPGPNHITHRRQIMPRSDKHVIKRSGGKDNYVHWKWNNRQVFRHVLTTAPCFIVSVYLVVAGYDIDQPTRILTRVSFIVWSTLF